MAGTVTVTRQGAQRVNAKYTATFSQLPGQSFGPWSMTEMIKDLRVSALLEPIEARNLVLDAHAKGSATTEMGC